MEVVKSKNQVPIRLTAERWMHITEEHTELAGYYYEILETIQNPSFIFCGKENELIAIKEIESEKYLLVFYKEQNENDGFVITAFMTRQLDKIKRRKQIWP